MSFEKGERCPIGTKRQNGNTSIYYCEDVFLAFLAEYHNRQILLHVQIWLLIYITSFCWCKWGNTQIRKIFYFPVQQTYISLIVSSTTDILFSLFSVQQTYCFIFVSSTPDVFFTNCFQCNRRIVLLVLVQQMYCFPIVFSATDVLFSNCFQCNRRIVLLFLVQQMYCFLLVFSATDVLFSLFPVQQMYCSLIVSVEQAYCSLCFVSSTTNVLFSNCFQYNRRMFLCFQCNRCINLCFQWNGRIVFPLFCF